MRKIVIAGIAGAILGYCLSVNGFTVYTVIGVLMAPILIINAAL
jgi:hypothetical protein